MQPNTYKDWLEVSRERQEDAEALLVSRKESIGSVYMAGYSLECCLKAFLLLKTKKRPPRIHNIRNLWRSAGFRSTEINDKNGQRTFFFDHWQTDFRYTTTLPKEYNSEQLVRSTRQLTNWIRRKIQIEINEGGSK
ncbi:MAG: HEPN domain-containing protein [bacterium]|nr:HEPN domain-containing protein [bacterium]